MSMRLNERDYAVLLALGTTRYIPARGLDWLFVAERARPKDARRARYPHRWVYERMGQLTEAGYVRPLECEGERVYALRRAGAAALHAHWGTPLNSLTTTDGEIGLDKLAHAVAIGRFYAALRAQVERSSGPELHGWAIDARIEPRDGIVPDAAFHLVDEQREQATPYLLEIDRGGRSLATWEPKAQTYASWLRAGELVLLIVAPSRGRLANIAGIVATETGSTDRVRYALEEAITPEAIGQGWYAVREDDTLTACLIR